jgi:light-regulated signal transduction histidine kinase (bacteriophytochrome)
MESESNLKILVVFSNLNSPLKIAGMGLGLGIIKNIIENYKGTITFDTEYGRGHVLQCHSNN